MREGIGWNDLTLKSAPNFCDEEGECYLVRCPECEKENYSPAVASGMCSWCGYDLNKKFLSKYFPGNPQQKTSLGSSLKQH